MNSCCLNLWWTNAFLVGVWVKTLYTRRHSKIYKKCAVEISKNKENFWKHTVVWWKSLTQLFGIYTSIYGYFAVAPSINFAKKAKSERKFIKEGKRRNADAFQVFLTQKSFLYGEHLTARFSWWSNTIRRKLWSSR